MGIEYWKQLVKKYADGKPICNCGDAYYTPCGEGIDAEGRHRKDMLVCNHGCSWNQFDAKEQIAKKIVEEQTTEKK